MKKSGVLSLGTRRDATTWEKGCKRIGLDVPAPVKKSRPTMVEMEAFFKTSPEWIFFGGHFYGLKLYNEGNTHSVRFAADKVTVKAAKLTKELKKGSSSFNLHKNVEVVLWGGCNVCSGRDTPETLRKLFGRHLLIGFAGLTGWKVVDAMLGGGFIKSPNHFFSRAAGNTNDLVKIRDAWMNAARSGYSRHQFESRFRAIDPDGQEWKLENGVVKRSRKIG